MGLTSQEALLERTIGNVGRGDDNFSQQSGRTYRVFYDQWDREWGADCEKKTMLPTGNGLQPMFHAPLVPPQMYLRVTQQIKGRMMVDCVRWITDLIAADQEFWRQAAFYARKIGGVKAHELYNRDKRTLEPQLVEAVGHAPMPIEVIQAMRAKNPWILGLKNPDGSDPKKPAKVPREFFPDDAELAAKDVLRLIDPWADVPEGAIRGEIQDAPPIEYPVHKGANRWLLSDEHARQVGSEEADYFTGTKLKAIDAIQNGWQSPVVPKVEDPGWDD